MLRIAWGTVFAGLVMVAGNAAWAGEGESPVKLAVEGDAVYGVFVDGNAEPVLVVRGPAGATVGLTVTDVAGRAAPLPAAELGDAGEARLPLPAARGYYRVDAVAQGDADAPGAALDYAIVPLQAPEARPESFFASNTSHMREGDELALLNRIGMRVQRVHFQPRVDTRRAPDGTALPADFTELDRRWKVVREADSWVLPIVGYSFTPDAANALAVKANMYGPPRDYAEFCATWKTVLEHYPELTTYEFWNEPWIFGWSWAGTPAEYRALQKQWFDMAFDHNPNLRFLAGNSSMFVEDHIEAYPESWKDRLHGTTHHPYMHAGYHTMRRGGMGRSIDHGMLVTRRMGLPFYYLTEGGTEFRDLSALNHRGNNRPNARKVVHYHVRTALVGGYQANIQWNIGYGAGWTLPNATYATLAHFIEDRPCVAEVWPDHALVTGAVFAHPRHVDDAVRALPRADELAVRWAVPVPPERADDALKVAVLYSFTGRSNDEPDAGATLTLTPVGDLRAYDMVGREIAPDGDRLVLPFGEDPVYVTTEALSVVDFRRRLADAALAVPTFANVYAASLERPADQAQTLRVRVENQLNRPLEGVVTVRPTDGDAVFTAPFRAESGRLVDVAVPWAGVALRPDNQYGATVRVESPDAGAVERLQILAVARFVKKTPAVDGDLADWADATPVVLDAAALQGGLDLTRYLLNPALERPNENAENDERFVARLWMAYDDDFVYLAAAVDEKTFSNQAGRPVKRGDADLPYRVGMPDGLDHFYLTGDSLAFAFGFRDRVPGWGRQMDDPWAWKGQFYDTDYHYAVYPSTDGPQLIRQWGADTPRRTGYQTVAEPWITEVPGAKAALVRDEAAKKTYYELAIPRAELALFDPAAGHLRFAFQFYTDNPADHSEPMRWTEAAGVFDHWYNSGSFAPSWGENLPCQTFFGIEP